MKLKVSVNLFIQCEEIRRIFWLQKDLELNFQPTKEMCFNPKLGIEKRHQVMKGINIEAKIDDIGWSEWSDVDLEISASVEVSPEVWNIVNQESETIDRETGWGDVGAPRSLDEDYLNRLYS